MKQIFILNGFPQSGKNTFVEYVGKYIPTTHISIVDNIKEIAKFIGWNGVKDKKGREFLFDLKTAVDKYNDGNYEYVKNVVEMFKNNKIKSNLLFIDIRDKETIERAVKDFGAKTVLVRRTTDSNYSNNADKNVLDFKNYDYIIDNKSDKEHLKTTAEKFAKQFYEKQKDTNTIKNDLLSLLYLIDLL